METPKFKKEIPKILKTLALGIIITLISTTHSDALAASATDNSDYIQNLHEAEAGLSEAEKKWVNIGHMSLEASPKHAVTAFTEALKFNPDNEEYKQLLAQAKANLAKTSK